jgi:hypothetical protein
MKYREIVSVTGLQGLYQLIASKTDGAIVRSLDDGTSRFLPARINTVTQLESIEVYTTGANVLLQVVFEGMKNHDAVERPFPKTASTDAIQKYFSVVFPELDLERVYVSDMKKMLKWYEILKKNELLQFTSVEEKTEEKLAEEIPTEETAEEEKPKKKTKVKKENEAAVEEEKPKKTARKKKTEE